MDKEYKTLQAEVRSYPDGTIEVLTGEWGASFREAEEVLRHLKTLEGKTLTVLEASIENERQLEALKSVLRQEIIAVYNSLRPKRRLTAVHESEQSERHADISDNDKSE